MSSIVLELRLAVRRLIGEPGLSVPAVATLAIGIGIAASVFALVDGVLLHPLYSSYSACAVGSSQ